MNGASRAWFEKDFYQVLGVPENASADEIKRAYKKLATTYHPDRNPDDARAEERMKEISEAYGVLGNPEKRVEYDQVRRMSRAGVGAGAPGGVHFEGAPFDLEDLFGGIFSGRSGARRGRRGVDLEASVRLSFEDAFRGATVPVRFRREAPCSTCNGSGDRSGRAQVCTACGGSGMSAQNQGLLSFARTCSRCGGTGRTVQEPCTSCGGSGVERRVETMNVKVPAGIKDGARIRVRGRGGAVQGGETGDLFVRVTVEPHPLFERRGNDLTLTLPVSFPAVALGAKVGVPTMNGAVTLKVPAGTQPGKTFRVRGKGVPSAGGTGDLLVTVQVDVPKKLRKEERRLIEELAQLEGSDAAGGNDDG